MSYATDELGLDPERNFDLTPPLEAQGGIIGGLQLREPTAVQVWRAEGNLNTPGPDATTLYMRDLVAYVAGLAKPDVLDALSLNRIGIAFDYLDGFIDAGTGDVDEADLIEGLELAFPTVTWNGIDYATLRMAEPSTLAVRKAQQFLRKDMAPQALRSFQMHLVANSVSVPYDVIKHIPVSTLNRASMILRGFTVAGRRTGPG